MRFLIPRLPTDTSLLIPALYDNFRQIAAHLSGLSKGHINAQDSYTAAPTTGSWEQGDFVRNSGVSELGTAGNKYVILGWCVVQSGTPGTWVEVRALTGN